MPIKHIHTFLVHPNKGVENPPQINGTPVLMKGPLFDLLNEIYARSDEECKTEIIFRPTPNGVQQNDCRDLICTYVTGPTMPRGRAIARRLEQHTDHRSGLGLLFLIAGKEGNEHKIVISRFPTDRGIYVDEDPKKFTVEFLQRIFMKNRTSYKAVAYSDRSIKAGFWSGRSVDRQRRGPGGVGSSDYWIQDFLASDDKTTPATGTRWLAIALREAAKSPALGIDAKQEITAAATLVTGLVGETISIAEITERFSISDEAKEAIISSLKTPELANKRFQFDLPTYQALVAYRSVELDNGGMLTAPSDHFDDVFQMEVVDEKEHQARFTTEGRIVDEKLRTRS